MANKQQFKNSYCNQLSHLCPVNKYNSYTQHNHPNISNRYHDPYDLSHHQPMISPMTSYNQHHQIPHLYYQNIAAQDIDMDGQEFVEYDHLNRNTKLQYQIQKHHSYQINSGRNSNYKLGRGPIRSPINQYEGSENSQLTNKIDRLNEIQSTMGLENQNLKQHNQYLLKMLNKLMKREEKQKAEIIKYKLVNRDLQRENERWKQKYEETKHFMNENINKIQKMMELQGQNISSDTSTSFHQQTNEPRILHNYVIESQIVQQKARPPLRSQNTLQNYLPKHETIKVGQLSDKFDAIMFEYRKTRDPSLRRQCIEIAKQMKAMKNNEKL